MKTNHILYLLFVAIAFLPTACDEHRAASLVGQVGETPSEGAVQTMRIDLTDPEKSLSGIFQEVFRGEKTVQGIDGLWTLIIVRERIAEEFIMPTEGFILSRMTSSSFQLTLHGVPATQAATADAGREFCKIFGPSEIDDSSIDEWVQHGQSRIDKTFRRPLKIDGTRCVINFLQSFGDTSKPYRLYISIYFDSKE